MIVWEKPLMIFPKKPHTNFPLREYCMSSMVMYHSSIMCHLKLFVLSIVLQVRSFSFYGQGYMFGLPYKVISILDCNINIPSISIHASVIRVDSFAHHKGATLYIHTNVESFFTIWKIYKMITSNSYNGIEK